MSLKYEVPNISILKFQINLLNDSWIRFYSAAIEVLQNKGFLKFCEFNRKTPVLESLFNKGLRPATLLKRGSDTGVCLWNLQIFKEHLFWRTSANDCL